MSKKQKQSLAGGAFVLFIATFLVQVVGLVYKIPLYNIYGAAGRGYFSTAYALYVPLYAISMGGLPVAISRLTAENVSLGHFRQARQVRNVALKIFCITGSVGTIAMFAFAYPYLQLAKANTLALPGILAIAPCIFLCCIMSSYRGYYEGMGNMIPTAVSRIIESLGKMVFGVVAAYFTVEYLKNEYYTKGTVLGKTIELEDIALDTIFAWGSAVSIFAVTLGTVFALIYLMIKHKKNGDGFTKEELNNSPAPMKNSLIAKRIIAVAIPIVLTSLINNLSNLIDATTIQNRLGFACETGWNTVISSFGNIVPQSAINLGVSGVVNYLWGEYNTMLDFKNIVPTITQVLGVSALPALAGVWALKDRVKVKSTVESVFRITMLISLPAGFGMATLSKPILSLFYKSTDISLMASMLTVYGFGIFLIALSAPVTNMLQAIGRTDIPIKSMFIGSVIKIILNYILVGTPSISIKGAPYSTLAMYLVMMTYNIVQLCKITGYRPNIIATVFKPAFSAGICAFGAWGSHKYVNIILPNSVSILVAVVVAVILYLFSLFILKGITKSDILMLPKGEKICKRLEKYRIIR